MNYHWRRIGAFVIDLSVISMFAKIFLYFSYPMLALTFNNLIIDIFKIFLVLFIRVLVAVGYNMICYKYTKLPLGKLLLNVQVLDENGDRVSMDKYFVREWSKYIFIYSTIGFYIPYQFFKNVINNKQTLHDNKSNTHIYM